MKIHLLLLIATTQSLLSERLWSDFFPEKQKHGLIKIDKDEDDMFYWLFPSR